VIACSGIAPEAVFGGEDGCYVYPVFDQYVEHVPVTHTAGVVGKEGDAPVFQQREIVAGSFGADYYGGLRLEGGDTVQPQEGE
jgi:hypothetical protein